MADDNDEMFIIGMSRMGYGHPVFDVMAMAAASVNLLVAPVSLPVRVMASSRNTFAIAFLLVFTYNISRDTERKTCRGGKLVRTGKQNR